LAEKWEGQTFTSNHVDGNYLDRIDIFVLLDLLGAKDPVIFSTHQSTQVCENIPKLSSFTRHPLKLNILWHLLCVPGELYGSSSRRMLTSPSALNPPGVFIGSLAQQFTLSARYEI
jgi:hypothetical protein